MQGKQDHQANVSLKEQTQPKVRWWKSIGPALITACVVFGPGSLMISSKVGATFQYQMLWGLALAGIIMGNFVMMASKIGVAGGNTPCGLLAADLGRPVAALVGITLALTCAAFQFSNNLAVIGVAEIFVKKFAETHPFFQQHELAIASGVLIAFNLITVTFLFTAKKIYQVIERLMKVMVGLILVCFLFNLFYAKPDLGEVAAGFIPSLPEEVSFRLGDASSAGLILIASLLSTTCSIAGAFFQGNLVRERGWTIKDYRGSIGDSIAGVSVLTGVSLIIMITAGSVLYGMEGLDVSQLRIADLPNSLRPALGATAFWVFSIGLIGVAMNPFLINAMIGGAALADGVGLPPKFSDRWPRVFTVMVMLLGMTIALFAKLTGANTLNLIVFGQALAVVGGPLMALSLLWLGNRKKIMGEYRNGWISNTLGVVGLLVVLLVTCSLVLKIAAKFN